MNIKINGIDFSEEIVETSIKFRHQKIQGQNGGISMGGSQIFDTIAIKSGFSATAGLLTPEKYRSLVFLAKMDCVTVVYDDPDTGKETQKAMILTASAPTQITLLGGGYMYKNMELDFVER